VDKLVSESKKKEEKKNRLKNIATGIPPHSHLLKKNEDIIYVNEGDDSY